MKKILIGCLVIASLLSAGCSRRAMGEDGKLNILCYGFQRGEIVDAYEEAYASDDTIPLLNFITFEDDLSDMEELYDQLIKSLLTKSPDIDLYCIASSQDIVPVILRNHYYVDLSRDDKLNAHFDAMYPEIRDWCTDGDEIFGFPFNVICQNHIMVNLDMMDTIGYSAGDIRTVDGLLDFCDAWRKAESSPPNDGFPIAPSKYYYNYILLNYDRSTGKLDLDTPEFRSILTQCRDLLAYEDLFQRSSGLMSDIDSDASPLYFECGCILSGNPQYEPIVYPLLDAEEADAKRFSYITWLIINPYGRHVDQVMACLTALAGAVGKSDMYIPTPIYRNTGYYADQDLYSQERLDAAGEFLTHMDVGIVFPGFEEIMSLCNQYVYDGTKTLDEVIAEAQHTLDMMREEQYIGE